MAMRRKGQRDVTLAGTKIRKRGCSSSPSSSSRVHNYRFNKRAILVGKNRAGLVRSRSSTPAPVWRTNPLRSAVETPKSGKSTRPVSARRLAATLWEMNEMLLPEMGDVSNLESMKRQQKKNVMSRMVIKGDQRLMQCGWGLHSPHLSDPPHSPTFSEKMDRSGRGSRRRWTQKFLSADQNDSLSNASFKEISAVGGKSRLKDVSSALTTSKELLKIISRIWAEADHPSSTASLISALHAELERARLQVNQLIREQRSDENEVNYLMKCFAEEKALWKNKEQLAVEAAFVPVARELEAERKLRRRLESLNTKLGKEMSEVRSSLMKVVRELESEKGARELTEQVCDELARKMSEGRGEVEKLKRESVRVHEDVEMEREMLELVDKVQEERAQMKLSEARHQFEEKSSAISKLRKQLEVFLGTRRDGDGDIQRDTYSSKLRIGRNEHEGEDEEEVDDDDDNDSVESDLHSIELDLSNSNNTDNKGNKWASYTTAVDVEPTKETKARNSISGSIQRVSSDGVECAAAAAQVAAGKQGEKGFHVAEKEAPRSSYLDEMQRLKSAAKGLKNHVPRLGRENNCPSPKEEQSCPERSNRRAAEDPNGESFVEYPPIHCLSTTSQPFHIEV